MKLFWSWQSDTPGKTGRHFVRDALDAAVTELKRDLTLDEPREREALNAMHVDQDRQGVAGSVDLFPEILKKIEASDLVIADVTLIGIVDPALPKPQDNEREKHLINSNVAIELGYAYRARTNSFVLLVMNDHYGKHEDLPFDLRHKGGTIVFTLAPNATKAEITKAGKALKSRLVDAIRLCLSAKMAEEDASAPVPGLLALGPDIICEGDILGFDQAEWKVHLRDFVVGDVSTLIKFVEQFEQTDASNRYVLLNALGDGRRLTAAPSLTREGTSYIARCPIATSFPRIEAQAMPNTLATSSETDDVFLERGSIARVSGTAAIPQIFRSTLSMIKGESPFHLTAGSRLQEYYWKFREDKRLGGILKLEVIRQAAIPYSSPANEPEHTPLWCVEYVQSVGILSETPDEGRLPLSLELDIKGLGRVEQKVSVAMPPADKVSELSKKGEAVGLFRQHAPVKATPPAPKSHPRQNRNLKRLSVVTRRWEPAGLELEIGYEPESRHIGLSARVTLLSPEDGILKPGVPVHNPAPTMKGYVRYEVGGPSVGGIGTIRLNVDTRTYKPTLMGIIFVFPSEKATGPLPIARVRIEIVTDADETLVSHDLAVSPMKQGIA
jgi:hypothetical protein